MENRVKNQRAPRFDREWKELISLLPPERRELMTQAIKSYQIDGLIPSDLQGAELMAFSLIKKTVDRRRRQREAARRRKAASLTALKSETAVEPPSRRDVAVDSRKATTPSQSVSVEEPMSPKTDAGAHVGHAPSHRSPKAGLLKAREAHVRARRITTERHRRKQS